LRYIDAEALRVHMDIKARGAGKCFVYIHKPSAFPGEDKKEIVMLDGIRGMKFRGEGHEELG
jgi:hypothetical protein